MALVALARIEVTTPSDDNAEPTATIIGAGAAGLSAAYTLRRNGFSNFVLLEANPSQWGGRIQTDSTTFPGFKLDLGVHKTTAIRWGSSLITTSTPSRIPPK